MLTSALPAANSSLQPLTKLRGGLILYGQVGTIGPAMLDATWWHMVFSPSIHLYMTASVMSLGTLNQKIHEDWIAVQELAR